MKYKFNFIKLWFGFSPSLQMWEVAQQFFAIKVLFLIELFSLFLPMHSDGDNQSQTETAKG